MLDKILDLLFPPKCPFCGKILESKKPVCDKCEDTLPFIDEKACRICGRPIEETSHEICSMCRNEKIYFEHAFIPLVYKAKAKDAILALKSSHPYYAKGFAYLVANKIISSGHYSPFDMITFVPQNRKSFRRRGYNQAELIAKELAKFLALPCKSTLRRTDDGLPQHTLNIAQRRENVKKCFFPTNEKFSGTVLLVDDIYTTGATANHCAKLLCKMGFDRVYLATALIRTED